MVDTIHSSYTVDLAGSYYTNDINNPNSSNQHFSQKLTIPDKNGISF